MEESILCGRLAQIQTTERCRRVVFRVVIARQIDLLTRWIENQLNKDFPGRPGWFGSIALPVLQGAAANLQFGRLFIAG